MTGGWRRLGALALAGALAVGCAACRDVASEDTPTDREGMTLESEAETEAVAAARFERASESGAYRVTIRRAPQAGPHSTLHAWLVRIEDTAGGALRPTRLAFSAEMPQHAHGLQTAPHATRIVDGDWIRVDGVRFHMPGEWLLHVEFVAPLGADRAEFPIVVPY